MEIPLDTPGLITAGDDTGWTVMIEYDPQSTGGYYIFTSQGDGSYDNWVPDHESLEDYFKESDWQITWDTKGTREK